MASRTGDPVELRQKAEARFKLTEQRQTDAAKAMSDVRAAREAESAKTTRLRALRLAKEASDREALAAKPPAAKGRKTVKA